MSTRQQAAVGTVRFGLLDGGLAERVRARVHDIAADLLKAGPPGAAFDPSIGSGAAGLAVVHAVVADVTGDERHRRRAAEHLAHARTVVRTRRTSRTLYGGFVGVAWGIEHLAAADDSDPLAGIDATLVRVLERSPWRGHYDVVGGLVGLGVYGLERLPRVSGRTICGLVVDRLAELAEPRPVGVTWHTPARLLFPPTAERFPHGWRNIGMAHGSPGVMVFLGGCLAAGVAEERAGPLLDDAVAWVLGERLDVPGRHFPEFRAPGVDPVPARAAWCYGDPGVAAALLVAGRSAGRLHWEQVAVEVALDASARTIGDAGVVDTSLCHGAAGLAHLYARMHHATGNPALAEAARTWYGRVFELPDQVNDAGTVDHGFLMGQGGVALALLAGMEEREPTWDRLLGLSTPAGRGHG